MKQLQGYSSSAATKFTRSFENMQSATKNGRTCKGQNLTTEGLQIYNTLKNCSVSVPVACNIANIDIDPGFQTFQQENETITKCIPLLDKYGTDYKVSSDKCRKQIIFLYNFFLSRKSCSTSLTMYQQMCAPKCHNRLSQLQTNKLTPCLPIFAFHKRSKRWTNPPRIFSDNVLM